MSRAGTGRGQIPHPVQADLRALAWVPPKWIIPIQWLCRRVGEHKQLFAAQMARDCSIREEVARQLVQSEWAEWAYEAMGEMRPLSDKQSGSQSGRPPGTFADSDITLENQALALLDDTSREPKADAKADVGRTPSFVARPPTTNGAL